jgi:hypothetical protein
MDKKSWPHSFASFSIKRKLRRESRNPRMSDYEPGRHPAVGRTKTVRDESKANPWMGLFDDPALHEALDRIMAANRIA